MKYLKYFENISENEPGIGDYVVLQLNRKESFPYLSKFISNNVGQIIDKKEVDFDDIFNNNTSIIVKYYDMPKNVQNEIFKRSDTKVFRRELKNGKTYYTIRISIKLVVCYSTDKEDIEAYLSAKNFNL